MSNPTSSALATTARDLERLLHALQVLAAELPPRTSIRQAMAFVTLAFAGSMGESMTLTDMREQAGDDKDGVALFGQSVERILNAFLEPTRRDPEGLGWITQEVDEDDRRKKYLKLTPEGRKVAVRLAEALRA